MDKSDNTQVSGLGRLLDEDYSHLKPGEREILIDEPDVFMYVMITKDNKPLICAYNRCSFTWWRNAKKS